MEVMEVMGVRERVHVNAHLLRQCDVWINSNKEDNDDELSH